MHDGSDFGRPHAGTIAVDGMHATGHPSPLASRPPATPAPPIRPVNETSPEPVPAADTWEGILAALRRRYPGQKDSVLFCINKLQQNPELTLRDFRAEAELYRIPIAGRSLHSARLLLGLVKEDKQPTADPLQAALQPIERPARRARGASRSGRETDDGPVSIETQVLSAVRQIQSAAGAEAQTLRAAIQQAIAILQRALDAN